MINKIIAISGILVITSCGGGGGGGGGSGSGSGSGSGESNDESSTINPNNIDDQSTFINWSGSQNGTYVLDATDDIFRFRSASGLMYFGSTTITNVWVDGNAGLYFNSQNIGDVTYVQGTDGSTITGLISNSGKYIDFYGYESDLKWSVSSKTPIFAQASYDGLGNGFSVKALESNYKSTNPIVNEVSVDVPNAFIENRPLYSEGYVTEANKQ